eukprot:scaffold67589_cov36-Tisochrysis_lutea.AAC.1
MPALLLSVSRIPPSLSHPTRNSARKLILNSSSFWVSSGASRALGMPLRRLAGVPCRGRFTAYYHLHLPTYHSS